MTELIGSHLPWTLLLTGTALTVSSLLGIVGGTQAAWKRGAATDRALTAASVIVGNTPVYFSGMLLLIVFGATLKWPPAGGRAHAVRPLRNALGCGGRYRAAPGTARDDADAIPPGHPISARSQQRRHDSRRGLYARGAGERPVSRPLEVGTRSAQCPAAFRCPLRRAQPAWRSPGPSSSRRCSTIRVWAV